jgi:hypothetical protein
MRSNLRHPFLQVMLKEVLKFTSKLDTSGTTTNNNHVQKALHLLFTLTRESSSFTAVHDTLADVLGILDLLQEAGVLFDTRDTLFALASYSSELIPSNH